MWEWACNGRSRAGAGGGVDGQADSGRSTKNEHLFSACSLPGTVLAALGMLSAQKCQVIISPRCWVQDSSPDLLASQASALYTLTWMHIQFPGSFSAQFSSSFSSTPHSPHSPQGSLCPHMAPLHASDLSRLLLITTHLSSLPFIKSPVGAWRANQFKWKCKNVFSVSTWVKRIHEKLQFWLLIRMIRYEWETDWECIRNHFLVTVIKIQPEFT